MSTSPQPPQAGETDDRLLDGRVILRQPARGYRAGMDAALLAAACDAKPGDRVLDVGCGPGAVLLASAHRRPGAHFTGLERDPASAALARRNVEANRVEAQILDGNVASGFRALALAPFDAVLCNPPFFEDADTLRGPSPDRRGAWIADDGLAVWLEFLVKAVREGGTITLIHRADALGAILAGLAPKTGSIQIRGVHPFADAPAKRVLVRAIKTGKAPLVLLPPLVLHDRGGAQHTAEADAILRGEAALAWA